MYSIWKYHIPMEDRFTMELPKDSMILDIQVQFDKPTMWVLVDTDADLEERYFKVLGTGFEFETVEELTHIGTIQMSAGVLVWHIFESYK